MKKKYIIVFSILFLIPYTLFSGKRGELIVNFIDVGEGESTLIITPSKNKILIDGGNENASTKIISILEKYNITRIDSILLTTPKQEHCGGLIDIIKNYDVGYIYEPGLAASLYTYEKFLETIMAKQDRLSETKNFDTHLSDILSKKYHYEYSPVRAGDTLNIDPDIEIIVLNPPFLYKNSTSDIDNSSLVIKIIYGKISFLFTGDISTEAEKYLISQSYKLKATILKVPLHGDYKANKLFFIKKIKPEVAIIFTGKNNKNGYPSLNTLRNYKKIKTQLYRTDLNGTIKIVTDGFKYKIYPEKRIPITKIYNLVYNCKKKINYYSNNITSKKLININEATAEDLLKLPSLGIVKSQLIIKYRNKHGKFKDIDDLKNVPGLTDKIINKIKDKIKF